MNTRTSSAPAVTDPDIAINTNARMAPRWRVSLWNDPVHSFEFVIELLRQVFRVDMNTAVVLTIEIHERGSSIAATCSRERAELYLEQVAARREWRNQQDLGPLGCTTEPAD